MLCYSERPHEDHIFGKVVGKSRRLKLSEVSEGFMRDGFTEELNGEGLIESHVENSDNDWIAQQVRTTMSQIHYNTFLPVFQYKCGFDGFH